MQTDHKHCDHDWQVCIVLLDENQDDGNIKMNKVVRKNLRVRLGDW